MTIKAIETQYKGYRFRSRLEARWAVFFDYLGLKWEYEPEGFELGNGVRYLPDFRVSGLDTNPDSFEFWFEVKANKELISAPEQSKMRAFAGAGLGALILLDGPPENRGYERVAPVGGFEDCDGPFPYRLWSHRRRPWVDCLTGTDEDDGYLDWGYHRGRGDDGVDGAPRRDLERAVVAARSARFGANDYGVCR